MPFCSNYGKEAGEGITFCPECGQRLKQGFTTEERQKYIEELKDSVGGGKASREDRNNKEDVSRNYYRLCHSGVNP